MYRRLLLYLLLCFCNIPAFAQTEEDNVIVTNKEVVFAFELNKKSGLFIDEKSTARYECTKEARNFVIAEFYNNYLEIKDIEVSGLKGVKPQYQMYQKEGVFYSDTKVCLLELPFTWKNKSAEVSFEKIFHDPHFFTTIYLSESQFIKSKTVKFIVPFWMDVDVHEKTFGSNIKKEVVNDEKNKTRTYIYSIENQKAEKQESDSPGRSYIYPHLLVVSKTATINGIKESIFDGLPSLYKWNQEAIFQENSDTAIISNKSREITEGCITPESKIKAIYAWVQNNIRYIAFEYGIGAFKPDEASNVLQKKYGDCKGMSNLLKSLLIAAGFDARLAWIGTNQISYDFSLPLPITDHMICALLWNNKLWFLDPTVKYMPLGEYAQNIQGRETMIENGENYLIEHVPSVSPSQNTDSISCEYTITGNTLIGKAINTFRGESKQLILSLIHSTEKDKQNNALKRFLGRGEVQDKVTSVIISGTDPQSDRLSINYEVERKSAIQTLNDELYIDPDTGKEYADMLIDTTRRENDFLFPYKVHIVRHTVLQIPQGYKVTGVPSGFTIKNDNLDFTISYILKDHQIIYRKEIVVSDPWVKKSHFKQWNADISAIKKAYMEQITLKRL